MRRLKCVPGSVLPTPRYRSRTVRRCRIGTWACQGHTGLSVTPPESRAASMAPRNMGSASQARLGPRAKLATWCSRNLTSRSQSLARCSATGGTAIQGALVRHCATCIMRCTSVRSNCAKRPLWSNMPARWLSYSRDSLSRRSTQEDMVKRLCTLCRFCSVWSRRPMRGLGTKRSYAGRPQPCPHPSAPVLSVLRASPPSSIMRASSDGTKLQSSPTAGSRHTRPS